MTFWKWAWPTLIETRQEKARDARHAEGQSCIRGKRMLRRNLKSDQICNRMRYFENLVQHFFCGYAPTFYMNGEKPYLRRNLPRFPWLILRYKVYILILIPLRPSLLALPRPHNRTCPCAGITTAGGRTKRCPLQINGILDTMNLSRKEERKEHIRKVSSIPVKGWSGWCLVHKYRPCSIKRKIRHWTCAFAVEF